MKSIRSLFPLHLTVLSPLILLVACSGGESRSTTMADKDTPVSTITITGNDRMRFEPKAFTVKAGSEITLTFENIGRMPKATMGHNLAIIEPGVSVQAFADAAMGHPATAYIAPQYAHQVIAATAVLGPGESETLVFTAPAEPGDYPFVCSFPGHTPVGMVGLMTVVE